MVPRTDRSPQPRGGGTRRLVKSRQRRRRWKTVLIALLRQAERGDRLDELEKSGPRQIRAPAKRATAQWRRPAVRAAVAGTAPVRRILTPSTREPSTWWWRIWALQRRAVGAADRHRRRGLGDLDYSGRRRVGGSHLCDVVQERNAEQDSSGPHIGDRTRPARHADHRVEPRPTSAAGFHRRSPLSKSSAPAWPPAVNAVCNESRYHHIDHVCPIRKAGSEGDCSAARHIDMRDCA